MCRYFRTVLALLLMFLYKSHFTSMVAYGNANNTSIDLKCVCVCVYH